MNEIKKHILDDDKIGRLLLKQSFPAFVAILVTTTYGIVNTIFIGRFVGTLAIAGIAIISPLQMLAMAIGQMFGVGGASLISRSLGTGDHETAERVLGNSIIGVIVISIPVTIIGYVNPDFWLKLLGASGDILPYARDYYTVNLFGLVFQALSLTLSSLVRSEGNARNAMTGMAIGAVSNIALDAFFIITLDMGVKGAAIGTVIAQFLSIAFYMYFYFKGNSYLKIRIKYMAIKKNIMKGIMSIGVSNFIMSLSSGTSSLFLNRALITYGGELAMAGYGIINRLVIFSIMHGLAIGQGMQPIIGYNFGMKRYDRINKVLKIALIASFSFGLVLFIIIFTVPEALARIFTDDTELIEMSAYMMRYIFSTLPLTGCVLITIYTFQSLGNVMKSLLVTLRSFLFLLPLVLILPVFFKFKGVISAYPVTEALAFMVAMILLIPQFKEFRKLSTAVPSRVTKSAVKAKQIEE